MFEWLSDNRAWFALILIIGLLVAFVWSIRIGLRQTRLRAKDEVFGDPERTKGGWYWALCGVSALMLVWFYYSWGTARAVFPKAANELCQVAKINESLAPITAALPIRSRYLKSTTLVVRNSNQLARLKAEMPVGVFGRTEVARIETIIAQTGQLMQIMSSPDAVGDAALAELADVQGRLLDLSTMLTDGPSGLEPTAEALAQPKWGTSEVDIPILPMTPRGVMFDRVSVELVPIADQFLQIRNNSPEVETLITSTAELIATMKKSPPQLQLDEAATRQRHAYIKALERIFRRIDDAMIFPAASMAGVEKAVGTLYDAVGRAKGSLAFIDAVFFPGRGVAKSRTQCTEQGSGRWLPKPTDVVATFSTLANPDLAGGGG